MNNIAIKSILAAAVLTVTGISANAAETAIEEVSVMSSVDPAEVVTFKRSELASTEGREAVEARIRDAAKEVCGPTDYHRAGGLHGVKKSKECYHRAVSKAMRQIGADQVATAN